MMPPMTLPQAVELINRVRTVQHGMREMIERGDRFDLVEHALSAYKAGILLFEHAVEVEQHMSTLSAMLQTAQSAIQGLLDDPVVGPLVRQALNDLATPSEESANPSPSGNL